MFSIEAILNNLADGIVVLGADERIIYANQQAHVLLKATPGQMLGKTPAEAFGIHPQVQDTYRHLIAQPPGDRRDEAAISDGALPYVAALGNERREQFVEISLSVITMNDEADTVQNGYLLTFKDITEQKTTQVKAARQLAELTALRHVDRRVSSTLDIEDVLQTALQSAINMSGAESGFITLLEGSAGDDAVQEVIHNRSGVDMVDEDMPPPFIDLNANREANLSSTRSQITLPLFARGEELVGVMTLETSAEDGFHEDSFQIVKMMAGRVATAVENARLYTTTQRQLQELQTLYDQVRELEEVKTDMIRIASHDIKNPLGTLIGYLDLMDIDKAKLTEEHQSFLQTMLRLANRVQRIVDDILSLDRYQREGVRLFRFDLQSVLRRIVDDQLERVKAREQQLVLEMIETPLIIKGDPPQIQEAMSNLVDNAIKYTPEGGTISLQLGYAERKNCARFVVQDSGYGIPEHLQSRLFEPFYRAISKDTEMIDGTGLGLHLVKNIVERHRGHINFTSVAGEGSTFSFEIPLAED